MNIRRIIFCILPAAALMALMAAGAPAFCPMCKTTIESASQAEEFAGSLNLAALVLLAPPVMIFATLFGLFYRLRHATGQKVSADSADEKRRALTD